MSLEAQFEAMRLPELARIAVHEPAAVIARHETEVAKQFPAASPEWRHEHALARAHSLRHQAAVLAARSASPLVLSPPRRSFSWAWAWRLAVLAAVLFLCLRAASAQECGICIVKIQQGGSAVGTAAAPFTLNFGTNLAVSKTGSVYTLSASSTAATAFSGLTASTNSNTGTFAASGNTWDFTAALALKAPTPAGCTTSASGQFCFDPTGKTWHAFDGTADALWIAATNSGSSGQICESNANGTCTFADPIVSGPAANGAAPGGNPVLVAGWDGTDVRTLSTDASGHANVNVLGTVPVSGTFWQSVQPVSQSGTWTLQGSAANGAAVSGNPNLIAGSDGTDVRTISTDTSGRANVNVNSLPALAAGTNTIGAISNTSFTATQTSGANLHTDVDNFPATQPVSGTVTANAGTGFPVVLGTTQDVNDSTSGATQVLAAVSGKAIYFQYTLIATAAVTVEWEYGTGTNCGTGTTALVGPMSVGANGGAAPPQTIVVPSGNALCLNLGAAVQVGGSVSYAQQ